MNAKQRKQFKKKFSNLQVRMIAGMQKILDEHVGDDDDKFVTVGEFRKLLTEMKETQNDTH